MIAEYYPITGIEDAYIALGVQDSNSAYSAGTPFQTPPAETATWTITQSSQSFYGFNVKQDEIFGTETSSVVLRLNGISEEMDARIRGKALVSTTGRVAGSGNTEPPLCALGLKINKAPGEYIYLWFLKGRFSGGNVVAQTKADSVTINMREYTFTALETEKKFTFADAISGSTKTTGLTWFKGDTTALAFDAAGWFSQVQTPDITGAPPALELVSVLPEDGALDAPVGSVIALTFNNAIADSAVMVWYDGPPDSMTKSFNSSRTVLTITPDTTWQAEKDYKIFLTKVTDIYGQTLTDTVYTFTTTTAEA